jgi:uncharacterized protein
MLSELDKQKFVEILYSNITPSSPIQSSENLHGRHGELNQIEQALYAPGRHIFIYGDRGVGKTSLAQTAAFAHQSADNLPIMKSCTSDSTFFDIIHSIAQSIIQNPILQKITTTQKAGVQASLLSYEYQKTIEQGAVPEIKDLNAAIALIKYLAEYYSENTIVLIDEFDLMKSSVERTHFADFIKQLGDHKVKIKFIFCGIGESLDQLIESHGSCYRYLASIFLSPLNYTARFEIMDTAANAFGLNIGEPYRYRIAAISDGFPHYIHLVCEKLLWNMFNDDDCTDSITPEHYQSAIKSSVEGIELQLKKSYDKATIKKHDDYHEVLWAAADHADLIRHTDDIYNSYLRIIDMRSKEPLTKDKFNARLRSLRNEPCGSILELHMERQGWYQFRESIVRGYVRLFAESQEVPLALEVSPGGEPAKAIMHIKDKPRKRYRSIRIPPVRFRGE